MRRKFLENKLLRLKAKKENLTKKALESQDISEVRNINDVLAELNDEITDIQQELEAYTADEARSDSPTAAQIVNGGITAAFAQNPVPTAGAARSSVTENPYGSMEYRTAFRAFVTRGTPIPGKLIADINKYRDSLPAEMRDSLPITTSDTQPAIPLTIMQEVINTVRKRYGNLYRKVRKTSVPGGVEIPIGALKAKFKWITESTVSPRQGVGELGKIQFSYHVGEIRIAQSFLSNLLTIEAFESQIAEIIAIAYLEAMDTAILKGNGNGQPLGILNDTRVTGQTGHVISMGAQDLNDWTSWRKNFFAKLPLGYRSGEFIFPVGTVDAYLETMSDANNNPIFRQASGLEVNDGDAQNPNGRFFGRDISLVEPDIINDFDSASSNEVIGIYWQPNEYALNENFGFTFRRYFDEETNEWVTKALVVVDGKVINPNGFYIFKKS